jgi:purine-binding chemotaxis protein CheW
MLSIELQSNRFITQDDLKGNVNEVTQQYLAFKLDDQLYAVKLESVKEVRALEHIKAIPSLPHYILGIAAFRGEIATVVDLAARFGLPSNLPRPAKDLVVVVESEGHVIAVRIDQVLDIWQVRQSEVKALPDRAFPLPSRYLEGVFEKSAGLVVLLNLDKLISKAELHDIQVQIEAVPS